MSAPKEIKKDMAALNKTLNIISATPEEIFIASILKDHAMVQSELDSISPRTEENSRKFDELSLKELCLHNAIMTAYQNSDLDPEICLKIAGLEKCFVQ